MNGLAALPPLREVIARHGLSASKALGQNFLLDPQLLDRIARVAGDLEGQRVYEVGPGPRRPDPPAATRRSLGDGGGTRPALPAGAGRAVGGLRRPTPGDRGRRAGGRRT